MLNPDEPGISAANHLASDKASQMLADAITDPELFKSLLTRFGKVALEERAAPRFIPHLIGGAAAANNQESTQ